jgi:glyoxylate/hydroxypyruvate reductase A
METPNRRHSTCAHLLTFLQPRGATTSSSSAGAFKMPSPPVRLCGTLSAMRIHLQNPDNDPLFDFSRAMWEAAAARVHDIGAGHTVSIGVTPADFVAAMRDAEALVTDVSVIRALFPCPAPHLKLIFLTNAGLDRLAPFDWLPPGVALLNNRGTHAAKAGEFAIMSILMLASRIPAMAANQRHGKWRKLWGSVLAGRNLTVIGLGTLGGATAEHASRFGMRVTGIRAKPAPHPACVRVVGTDALDDVVPETEFLVLACPLTAATRGLMSRRWLECLPSGAGVVNIGRGELLDQDALCDLLDQGHLSGAVLDVFTPEPIPPGHRLWSTPNLIISPHTAADDPATYNKRSLAIFLENLRAWRDGRPLPNRYDIERGY